MIEPGQPPLIEDKPKESTLRVVLRWSIIGWTVFCVLGMGGCIVSNTITMASAPQSGMTQSGSALVGWIMAGIAWAGIWVVVSVPCAAIYVTSKKNRD